jgi:hypothetical protein
MQTEEARQKVHMLEAELESNPADKDLELQLEEAKAELEVFE